MNTENCREGVNTGICWEEYKYCEMFGKGMNTVRCVGKGMGTVRCVGKGKNTVRCVGNCMDTVK